MRNTYDWRQAAELPDRDDEPWEPISAHTPGPLAVGYYQPTPAFHAILEHAAVMRKSDGALIAVCGPSDCETSLADARLYRAAPDLLAAARWVAECWGRKEDEWIRSDMDEAITALLAAIARAQGEEPR